MANSALRLPSDAEPLPDGWKYVPLGSLVGARGISYGVVQPGAQVNGGVPIVRVNNFRNGGIDQSDAKLIAPEIADGYTRTKLRGGEILLSLVGSLGQVAIVPPALKGWNVARAVGVIPVEPASDARWVFYCLRSPQVQHYISVWKTTTVQETFNLRDVARLPIPMAESAATRYAIAHILGTLDDKIELNRRMNETLEAMARAIFKSWFVDFDPVRAKMEGREPAGLSPAIAALFPNSFEDSELGEIPKGWMAIDLGDEIQVTKGRSYKSSELADSSTALVSLKSIKRGGGYRPDGLKPFTGTFKPEQIVTPGELVVAYTDVTQAADVIGKPAIVRTDIRFETLVASLDLAIVRPAGSLPTTYLYCLLREPDFQIHAYAHTTGTTVLHLGKDALSSYPTCLPSRDLSAVFQSIVDPIFARMEANETEIISLADTRDAFLPRLLSGELKVAPSEAFADEAP